MVDIQDVIAAVAEELGEGEVFLSEGENSGRVFLGEGESSGGVFLVEVKAKGDEVEVFIDSDARDADGRIRHVTVDDCTRLTRAIEARFDRDTDDFSLTVSSAGVGQPLRHPRHFRKLVGRMVEVVTTNGAKIVGVLEGVEGAEGVERVEGAGAMESGVGSITLSYPEKRRTEGAKRPEVVTVTRTFALSEVKATREHIDFK
jgi:ribosome maturation factor RimP